MNTQREQFGKKVQEHMKAGAGDHHATEGKSSEHSSPVIGESKVIHHEDGSHSVEHHDGEKSTHASGAHMGMHMAAKHDGGEHGHLTPHPGGGATTHHVGMDGQVQGPMEHESEDEGYAHLKGNIGDCADGNMGEESGGAPMGGPHDDTGFE